MERQSFEERQTDRHKTNPDKQANRQIDKERNRRPERWTDRQQKKQKLL